MKETIWNMEYTLSVSKEQYEQQMILYRGTVKYDGALRSQQHHLSRHTLVYEKNNSGHK